MESRLYRPLVLLLLFLSVGCSGNGSDHHDSDLDLEYEVPNQIILTPVLPQDVKSDYEATEIVDISDVYFEHVYENENDNSEENDTMVISEIADEESFEILEIMGIADSIYGSRWESMLSWRGNAVELKKEFGDTVTLNMNPNDNAVFLTFDDGPDPVNTVSVINTLIEYDVSATFFFTGENMRRHVDVVQMAYDAGFTIGLHSYDHPHFTNLSETEIIDELNIPNDILESIVGSRSYIMRPPFGSANSREIEIIREQGYLVYLWSLDTLDWAMSDADDILQNVKDFLRPGDIILMHAFSGQARTAAILPEIIEFILERGYEIRALPKF